MPSVADELAALRATGSVKSRSTYFKEKSKRVSEAAFTPEAGAAALLAKREAKFGNIEAKELLNKGSNAGARAFVTQAAQFTAKKKEDFEKKAQATDILKTGGSAGGYSQVVEHSFNQTGRKKAEWEKKNETKKSMASSGSNDAKDDGAKDVAATQADKKSSEPVAVVTHRTNLSTGGAALSTPDMEAAILKSKHEDDELGNIKAKEFLSNGSSATVQSEPAPALVGEKYLVPALAEMKESSPGPAEVKESLPIHGSAAREEVSVSSLLDTQITKKESTNAHVATYETDPAVPVEIIRDVPKPAEVEDAVPELQITRTEESDNEDVSLSDMLRLKINIQHLFNEAHGDEEFTEFLKFLKNRRNVIRKVRHDNKEFTEFLKFLKS